MNFTSCGIPIPLVAASATTIAMGAMERMYICERKEEAGVGNLDDSVGQEESQYLKAKTRNEDCH